MSEQDSLRILLVEDDRAIGQLLKIAMRSLNLPYTLDHAYSAEEGLELWHQTPYDLVMTDYNLRGKNGLELVNQIRQSRADIPIMLFTAYESTQLRRQVEAAGVNAFIAKPFFVDQFISTVYRLLPPRLRERSAGS